MAKLDGPGLAMVGIGSLFVFAGIKGYSMAAVVQNLVRGKPIATDVNVTNPLAVEQTLGEAPADQSLGIAPGRKGDNRAIGKEMATSYGWGDGAEWAALETLWTHESGWNNHADNPSSHAYGIPQALPHTKMPKAAWPESAGGQSDAVSQIQWGLDYIHGRYGSPVMAWAFWQANNWY